MTSPIVDADMVAPNRTL